MKKPAPKATCPQCKTEWELPAAWQLRQQVAIKLAQKGKVLSHLCPKCREIARNSEKA